MPPFLLQFKCSLRLLGARHSNAALIRVSLSAPDCYAALLMAL